MTITTKSQQEAYFSMDELYYMKADCGKLKIYGKP